MFEGLWRKCGPPAIFETHPQLILCLSPSQLKNSGALSAPQKRGLVVLCKYWTCQWLCVCGLEARPVSSLSLLPAAGSLDMILFAQTT